MRTAAADPHGTDPTEASSLGETIDDLRLDVLNWLKIDAESDAKTILRGAGDTLWRLRPKLFLSVTDAQSSADVISIARDFGYACWRFDSPLFNAANFNMREDDVFDGSGALAVLAFPEEAPAQPVAECGTLIDQ